MISPIENNGMIARTQDYASMRNQDDTRAVASQIRIQEQIDEREGENVRTVHHSDDSDKADTRHDAREEGRNKYFDNRNRKKAKEQESDGIVRVKNRGGFDLKI